LTLVYIRRAHHLFPIRPYLPQLVAALEDGDAHVRDCARPSVIELFTGPGVTDAARADLKKEMTKKGVRKTIVDGVLSKLVPTNGAGGGNPPSDGSENGDASNGAVAKGSGYIPPSLALQSQRAAVDAVPGPSVSRPASRAAIAEPATPLGDNADIKPVYVSFSFFPSWLMSVLSIAR
jgi:CLIP-associating protein 1/2